ncbi:MAG: transporter [Muribaculaceae bacterium]|nr:transporter [Muribaculaceae bacterium]MDE7109726.1 transporter [Muribaculaceae bacterium]
MLPIAMVAGAIFYPWMGHLTFLSPYLIFTMLFITYCKLKISDFKPNRFEVTLLVTQIVLAILAYLLCYFWNRTLAEGVFICFIIPTATAAPVITSMLGGSISKVATYSLLCNAFVAIAGPLMFAAIGEHPEITFLHSFGMILAQVFPLILAPLALALILRYVSPKIHSKIVGMQQLSFYLWAVSLFIVVGSCVAFAIKNWTPESTSTMLLLALGALVACVLQFKLGRVIGGKFGDKVSGGQGLGQKNTVLAVWLALAYLNPIASIAPASYVAWQNIINSWQLMRHQSRLRKSFPESDSSKR